MTDLYLIRHGQSQGNVAGNEGINDPELTELGEEQARALKDSDLPESFDVIFVSPLRRAWQTLKLSNKKAKSIFYDSRLVEVDGSGTSNYQGFHPTVDKELARIDLQNAWLLNINQRVSSFLGDVLENYKDCKIGVFAHHGTNGYIGKTFLDNQVKLEELGMKNCSYSHLSENGSGDRFVNAWNSYRHLAAIGYT